MTAVPQRAPPNLSPRLRNPAKERMHAGELALGLIVRVARSPEIARIARATNHDFLFIDGQHAAFSPETVGGIAHAAHGSGVAPIVYAVGGRFTVADINLAEVLRYAQPAAELFAGFPAVAAWLGACQARPAFVEMMAQRDAEAA